MKSIIQSTLANLDGSEKNKLFLLSVSAVIISVADILFLAALVYFVAQFTDPSAAKNIFTTWFPQAGRNFFLCIFLLLFAAKNFAAYKLNKWQYSFVYQVSTRLSQLNLLKYLEGDFSNYTEADSSVHLHKIGRQPIEFCHYVLAGLQQIFTEAVITFFAIIAIFIYKPALVILLFCLLLPPVIIVVYFVRRQLQAVRRNIKSSSEKSIQLLQEALTGYVESNIYNKNSFFAGRYISCQQILNRQLAGLQSTHAIPARIIETFAVLGLFMLLFSSQFFGSSATVSIINIGAFLAAAYKIIPGIVKIINLGGQVKTYSFSINNAQDTYKGKPKNASIQNIHSVEFHDVNFGYDNIPVFQNFNMKMESGDFIGITGKSGCGKTTLLNLLLGFISPFSGEILINGQKMNMNERRNFWPRIAYVKQQPFVIADSVLNNIVLGENGADEKMLTKALKITGLEEFTTKLPEGINYLVAEDGKNISGGQQQRIVLARAFYKDADIIILDEPFNELDAAAEIKILKELKQMALLGKIIILISHSQNSLSYCDGIVEFPE